MKQISIGVFFLLGMLNISAQDTKTLWQTDLKSSTQDFLSGMTITLDRQYLLSGSSIQNKTGNQQPSSGNPKQNSGYDYHVVKLNQQGEKVWDQYFSGNRQDYLSSTIATQDGGFLLTGTSYSTMAQDKKLKSLGSSDIWVIRINEDGEELWQQVIGTRDGDEGRSAVQTTDLGFVVTGNTHLSKQGFGSSDVMVTKLDENGKIISQVILGGTGLDQVEKIIPSKDGGCLIGIYSQSGVYNGNTKASITSESLLNYSGSESGSNNSNSSSYSNSSTSTSQNGKNESNYTITFYGKQTENSGIGDYWIVKLDKNGNVEWERNYGGKEDDHIRTMALTDSGYVISGESRSSSSGNKRPSQKEGTDIWMITLDEDGNEEGQYAYSFGNRDIVMSLDVIQKQSTDNNQPSTKGFLIGGYTQGEEKKKKDDETFWMLYINKDGKEEWRKYVEGKEKKKEERLVDAKLQGDGTFLLAGTSADQLGEENWKIIKLGDKDLDNLIEKQDIRIYPNPVEDYAYVEIGNSVWDESNKNEEAEILLHDMSGRQVQSLKTKQQITKINTGSLPQGIYIITAQTKTKSVNSKIVKK